MPGFKEVGLDSESQKQFEQRNNFYKDGKYGDALQAYDRSYQQNPLGALRYNQGAALDRMGKAAFAFAGAYEQKPFPQFLYNVGASYDKAGDTQCAVQNYQLCLSMFPNADDGDKVRNRIPYVTESNWR
jgi:tetratricopeptide (TPR) repeat protein